MKLKSALSQKPTLAIALIVFLLMLAFNFMTPMLADDFSYCFSWADTSRITNPLQIIDSMAVHRQVTNGRVIAHALVQFMLIFPKALFNFVNAGVFLCLPFLLLRLTGINGKGRGLFLAGICAAFWVFTPAFGQVFLWLDGSVNYLWGMVFFLLYLSPFIKDYLDGNYRLGKPGFIGLLLLGFCAGAYSENGSPAILMIVICLCTLSRLAHGRFNRQLLLAIIPGFLGFAFLASAPAMAGRGSGFSPATIAYNILNIVSTAQERMWLLFLIFFCLLFLNLLFKTDRRRTILAALLFLGALASLAAFMLAAYFAERHFCFTVTFTILACLFLSKNLLSCGKPVFPALCAAVLTLLLLFKLPLGAMDIAVTYNKSLQRQQQIEQALSAGESSIYLNVYMPSTEYSAAFKLTDLSTNPDEWPNYSVALYYGFDQVYGVYYNGSPQA